MKKRIISILLISVLLISSAFVFAGKDGADGSFIVGMATDTGGLGDKSFNDGCHAGLKKAAEEFGIDARVIESKQQTDYIPNLTGLAEDGAQLVFAVGFLMEKALLESAEYNPDTYFAGIDIVVGEDAPKNVMGITFKEHESGYLAGVVAGMLTKDYANASDKLNDDNVLGVILGMDIPPVERFQAGFVAGVKSVNPSCKVLTIVAGSFTDQAKGKEAALTLIDKGADIVFPVAGLTGMGAINACKEKNVMAIGVDVDQNYLAPNTVVTSAVKGIANAAYLTIKETMNGDFVGSRTKEFGINQGATGIAPFHSFETIIPYEVRDMVKKVIADMKSGKITPPATRKEAGYSM